MVTIDDMIEAYFDCRRKKRNTASAIEFEMDYESKILELVRSINDRTYRPGKSICFVVKFPHYREVFAASFYDRIPHHYIANKLSPLMEDIFGDRIFNCREGKGQLYGVKMLEKDIKECSDNYTTDCYVMTLDISSFFMSINKQMLYELVDKFIVEHYFEQDKEDLRFLCKVVILHCPEKDCERHSPIEFWSHLPKSKSLFTNGNSLGMAIGNLFVQLFANFLLWFLEEVFDRFDIKYHGRYVDDMYAISRDKGKLFALIRAIREKLAELGLKLNEKKFYMQHYSKGVRFTGAIIKPGRSYVLNRTVNRLKLSIERLNNAKNDYQVNRAVCSINSYLGILRQHNEYSIRKRMLCSISHDVFKEYVYIKGRYESVKIKKKHELNHKIEEIVDSVYKRKRNDNAKIRRARRGGGRDSKPLPPSGCRKVG